MTRDRHRSTPLAATRALREFLATEAASGALLVVAAIAALVWANSPWRSSYDEFWHTAIALRVGAHELELDLRHWVNDGLMALFFLVVGLEVKRELVLGELRDRRRASLAVFAALGGMLVPAALYAVVNLGGDGRDGWGIPMATDIAFAIGVLALIAPAIPAGVRLFLLTLAIVDDIGAIAVIAVFYSADLEPLWLVAAGVILVGVVGLRRLRFRAAPLFAALGIGLWLTLHASGVHATLAGVAMGLLAPAAPALDRHIIRSRADQLLDVFTPQAARETTRLARQAVSELEWIEHQLHGWTSLLIVPLFALANSGVRVSGEMVGEAATSPITVGVVVGLVAGKTLGITAGAWIGVRLGYADLPESVGWRQLTGAAALGGVGFTVALFVANLAFDDPGHLDQAKLGILAASLTATALATALLRAHPRAP